MAEVVETAEINRVKVRLGVPRELASCHTAEIGEYVLEGHVPADAIKRLLAERSCGSRHAGWLARNFLTTVTRAEANRRPSTASVCRGHNELVSFITKKARHGDDTSLELVGSAHALAHYLAQTAPRSRGRRA